MPSAAKWPGELRPKEWTKAALRPILGRNNSSTQEFTASEEPFLQNKTADSVKPTQAKQGGKGTFSSSVFLLFNSAVGAGVLALPYCFVVGGILPTTIAIVFFAIITGLSSVAIVACQEASNSRDYQTIVKYYLGQTASSVMSAILATYCLLNSVGALVIIADQSGPVLTHFFGKQDVWWMQRETHVLVGGMLAFPLMCLREITSLKFTASLALAGMMFIVCCVIQQTITHPSSELEEDYGEVQFFGPTWASLLLALPSACLSYQNQMQVPNVYAELRPEIKNVRSMSMIILASKCIILPMYLATAFAGYYMFRSQTPPDILIAPYAQSAVQIFVARILLCMNAVFRVPVNHFTARSALYSLWERFGGKKSSESETTFSGSLFWIEVLTYTAIMLVLGCVLKSLDVVLDIMSATCAMAVMFFIPGAFLLKEGKTGGWRMLAWAFIIVGAALAMVSTGDTIVKLSSGQS